MKKVKQYVAEVVYCMVLKKTKPLHYINNIYYKIKAHIVFLQSSYNIFKFYLEFYYNYLSFAENLSRTKFDWSAT